MKKSLFIYFYFLKIIWKSMHQSYAEKVGKKLYFWITFCTTTLIFFFGKTSVFMLCLERNIFFGLPLATKEYFFLGLSPNL
ncbi:hypothetical protein RchiOBHm_Chr1g0321861 [Rosa chinensis]|uniref:Uncharacterized protein n=1 Tax=Rosa chinensis TaxID=74649 RepID=A0A2P6S979_ROSCH|nr:hypothetical protein RchiOBHm_Chr1g0321861 [Rosa chinensis]